MQFRRPQLPLPVILLLLSTLDECVWPVNAHGSDPRAFAQPHHDGLHRAAAPEDILLPPPNEGSHELDPGLQKPQSNGTLDTDVVCHPLGPCEPCPNDVMEEPYCQPFGNRRLVNCIPRHIHDNLSSPDSQSSSSVHPGQNPDMPLPAYESCGRVTAVERADFFEFVLTNVIFAALALVGVLLRGERMRAVQARRLAARIGVGLRRASSGNWARRLANADEARDGLLPT